MISGCLVALRQCCCSAKPFHELLTYETSKRVKIKDPFVGVLRLILILLCVAYFFVFRLYREFAYFKREQVSGVIQTSLQRPQSWSTDEPGLDSQAYCKAGSGSALSVLPCVTGPDAWVMSPSDGGTDLFIATRVKDVDGDGTSVDRQFVLEPEEYTVGVTFTAQALQHYFDTRDAAYNRPITDLETRLVGHDGSVISSGLTRIQRFDVFKVGTLLAAAGITSLDNPHSLDPAVSMRYDGLTLLVNINCKMEFDGGISRCEYKVDHIVQSVAETFLVTNYESSDLKTQERRGIAIKFRMSGEMGRFDWPSLMLAWVSSLVFVEICTYMIDWSMTYILPHRGIYKMVLYDESPDMHRLRKGDPKAVRAVKNLRVARMANQGEVNLERRLRNVEGNEVDDQFSRTNSRPSTPTSRASPVAASTGVHSMMPKERAGSPAPRSAPAHAPAGAPPQAQTGPAAAAGTGLLPPAQLQPGVSAQKAEPPHVEPQPLLQPEEDSTWAQPQPWEQGQAQPQPWEQAQVRSQPWEQAQAQSQPWEQAQAQSQPWEQAQAHSQPWEQPQPQLQPWEQPQHQYQAWEQPQLQPYQGLQPLLQPLPSAGQQPSLPQPPRPQTHEASFRDRAPAAIAIEGSSGELSPSAMALMDGEESELL